MFDLKQDKIEIATAKENIFYTESRAYIKVAGKEKFKCHENKKLTQE